MQHSIQLGEKDQYSVLKTKIIKVVERPIKIINDGRANMLNALGLELAETIFHTIGNGRPSSRGTINGVSVVAINIEKAQKKDGTATVYHFLDPHQVRNKRFEVGQKVELRLETVV
jgi:Ser-tRNA(Ala) deacylase AlaX